MDDDLKSLEPIFRDYLYLKKVRRTGWQLRGIRDGESIADHCFGVALLTMLLAEHLRSIKLNRDLAVTLALVHELGECRVGDIPFTALKYLTNKSEAEQNAVAEILKPMGKSADFFMERFREFEKGSSIEARFVRAVDKLEMLITAADYEQTGYQSLNDFWENQSTFDVLEEFPPLAIFAQTLKNSRKNRKV